MNGYIVVYLILRLFISNMWAYLIDFLRGFSLSRASLQRPSIYWHTVCRSMNEAG